MWEPPIRKGYQKNVKQWLDEVWQAETVAGKGDDPPSETRKGARTSTEKLSVATKPRVALSIAISCEDGSTGSIGPSGRRVSVVSGSSIEADIHTCSLRQQGGAASFISGRSRSHQPSATSGNATQVNPLTFNPSLLSRRLAPPRGLLCGLLCLPRNWVW